MSGSPLALPPVRLLPADVLARQALAVPLLDRALRLTRWAGEQRPVDGMGELLDDELRSAAAELGLTGEEGEAEAAQAWGVAVDTGLLVLEIDEEAEESTPAGEAAGVAVPGEAYARIGGGEAADGGADPHDVLDVWLNALECALEETAAADYENPPGDGDGQPVVPDGTEWDPEEEAELLDAALVNLYALSALEPAPAPGAPAADDGGAGGRGGVVPLPVLAASLVVPDEMEQPSEDVLEEVSLVMLRLDDHFRLLASTGLLDYTPMDEALVEEAEEDTDGFLAGSGDPDADEIARYGTVRLTPLGVHGVRERLADAGVHAPVIGDLAAAGADDLLGALASYPDHAVRAEAEAWCTGRKPADAARELLAAARGDGPDGPSRRLVCQQILMRLGPEAEPAVREVLDDLRLGGLARVWLTEHHAADIPAPTAQTVFWLTIDTVAAQLAADGDSEELAELVRDLLAQHDGFLDEAWRVDHPATAAVLEAIGRLHPDRATAKTARKAAFKARSRRTP